MTMSVEPLAYHVTPDDPVLRRAVAEANLLLAYAAENGIEIERKVIETVVGAARPAGADSEADIAATTRFWEAYGVVARAVHPVTSDSIEATMVRQGRRGITAPLLDRLFGPKLTTHAERSIYRFSIASFLVLVILLAVQMYWVIGNRLEAQSAQLVAEAEKLRDRQTVLRKASSNDDDPELMQLEAAGEQLNLDLAIRVTALEEWNDIWRALVPGIPQQAGEDDASVASPFSTMRKARLEASLAKECVELYLLPLLYGLLGSCLHVLRTLAAGIERRTHVTGRLYQVRIYTGGLTGLVIAWFGVGGDAGSPLASLTPFALAFLAGYSVELLFAFMDRIVSAFVGKSEKLPGEGVRRGAGG